MDINTIKIIGNKNIPPIKYPTSKVINYYHYNITIRQLNKQLN